MNVLNYNELQHGGFAGLEERRFVMDERVFSGRKNPNTSNGLGNFVYLADANFLPLGETHMHPHKEIDVISVMADGNISHQGSLEHGENLSIGEAQIQRAGGEGFSHNEINPDNKPNQLIQIWVLPDESGESAGYKVYRPKKGELTHIYGGKKDQNETMYSNTSISMVNAEKGQTFTHQGEVMIYLSKGTIKANNQEVPPRSLIQDKQGIELEVLSEDAQLIFFYLTK